MTTVNTVSNAKYQKAFARLDQKIKNLPGASGLIHATKRDNFGDNVNYPYYSVYVYPSYGFHCGAVEGNQLQRTTDFAKALLKACTLCKNFRYNGYMIKY